MGIREIYIRVVDTDILSIQFSWADCQDCLAAMEVSRNDEMFYLNSEGRGGILGGVVCTNARWDPPVAL